MHHPPRLVRAGKSLESKRNHRRENEIFELRWMERRLWKRSNGGRCVSVPSWFGGWFGRGTGMELGRTRGAALSRNACGPRASRRATGSGSRSVVLLVVQGDYSCGRVPAAAEELQDRPRSGRLVPVVAFGRGGTGRELAEQTLGHAVGSRIEAAHGVDRRGDRRELRRNGSRRCGKCRACARTSDPGSATSGSGRQPYYR